MTAEERAELTLDPEPVLYDVEIVDGAIHVMSAAFPHATVDLKGRVVVIRFACDDGEATDEPERFTSFREALATRAASVRVERVPRRGA